MNASPAAARLRGGAWLGWGGLALCALLGAASSGVSGVLVLSGLFVLVVSAVALVRGRVLWARLRGRAAGGAALVTSLVLMGIGGAFAPPGGATPAAAPSSPTQPSRSLTTGSGTATTTAGPMSSATTQPSATAASPSSSAAAQGTALAALRGLPVKGRAPKTGYSREQFGQAWADVDRNGCDTRNDILRRDLTSYVLKVGTNGCLVLSGTLKDPYTGRTIGFVRGAATSEAVQIDHVVALSDAWQKGAQQLSLTTRTALANDPLNLLAVDGPTNDAKGDGDAATWLPPSKSYRCAYVARQVAVKARYHLWVTTAERDAIARILTGCPGQRLPTAAAIPLGGGRTQAAAGVATTPDPTARSASLTCRATMSNTAPSQYSTTDVIVTTTAGAHVSATARYKTTTTTNAGIAGPGGTAQIAFRVSRATIGRAVPVDVTVSSGGRTGSCSTSFTPR